MTADPAGRRGPALVLGATGFVGHHVSAAFEAAGYEVVMVSRTPGGPPAEGASRAVAFDLLAASPHELTALLRRVRPTVVVNATGAVWDVSPRQMVRVNVALVRRLVRALEALDRPRPRLVQLGSVHEYGPVPPGAALDERVPERPGTVYGRTKLRGSRLVLEATAAGRLDAVVLRISNVVGPGTPGSSLLGRVAGQLSDAALDGTPALLRLAPLRAKRDFVDVRDITDAVVAAAERPVTGRVINLGRGEAVDVRWMVDALVAASGIPARVVDDTGDQPRRAGAEWQEIDHSAAHAALGWSPRRPLEDALLALWRDVADRRASRAS
ncbi:Nucleoside-diphosphate-sugar epimerase [Streptomyces misionensis]|uniref:Nucleoside-diphosphate-sugar epimerase n=1 Tax=Streptomyces misionensis TaxID=67331 RepID=A0A1H4IA49_9ACTN|nr:NAD(P)-dependent oxidoreductase [Streptomyces misionensis]SEB30871.1 Nucleoside-diphosphate-sugar epimerase [Streptomyces misionensis]